MDLGHGAETQQAPELSLCDVSLQNYHHVLMKQHGFHLYISHFMHMYMQVLILWLSKHWGEIAKKIKAQIKLYLCSRCDESNPYFV